VTLEKGRGKYPNFAPLVFTELASRCWRGVLRSKRAAAISIAIVHAFVHLHEKTAANKDLACSRQ
jgi:hypothetical protein